MHCHIVELLFVQALGELVEISCYHTDDCPMYYWLCFIVPKHPFYSRGQKMERNIWIHKQPPIMFHDTRVQTEDSTNSCRGFSGILDEFSSKGGEGRVKKNKGKRIFGGVCFVNCVRMRENTNMWLCVHMCVPLCPSPVKFVPLVCTLYHTAESILHGSSACVRTANWAAGLPCGSH